MSTMTTKVDMGDSNAWEDTALVNFWHNARKEYQKYYSIHKSGKRLEEVLTEEELKELRAEFFDVLEEQQSTPAADQEDVDQPDQNDTDMDSAETNGIEISGQEQTQEQELNASEQHQPAAITAPEVHDGARAPATPQAILGTVQDESLKNMMMSWYYAGYYTGLHEAQQQALKKNQDTKQ